MPYLFLSPKYDVSLIIILHAERGNIVQELDPRSQISRNNCMLPDLPCISLGVNFQVVGVKAAGIILALNSYK